MTIATLLATAIARLKAYNLDPFTADNPYGLSGVGGMDANWSRATQDMATASEATANAAEQVTTDAAQVATDKATVTTLTATTTTKAAQTAADAIATAADRIAVAADKTATHTDRLAADADAVATAADRVAVAADRTAVATDKAAAHADRLAADADATATAQDRTAVAADRATVVSKTAEAVAARDTAAGYAAQARGITWVPASGVGGTANAITLTPTPAVTTYAAGVALEWVVKQTNTAAVVVNISGLGDLAVNGTNGAALSSGALVLGSLVRIVHDGTAFRLGGGKAIDSALLNGSVESTQAQNWTIVRRDGSGAIYANQNWAIGTGNVLHAWYRSDAPVDNKRWEAVATTTTLTYRIVNDANSAATDCMAITRSGMTVTGINLLGPVTFSGGYRETAAARSNTGAARTLIATNNVQLHTISANTTLTLPTLVETAGDVTTLVIELIQDGTGGRTVTWAAPAGQSIKWNGSSAPTLNAAAGKLHRFLFTKNQGDAWWTGALIYKE